MWLSPETGDGNRIEAFCSPAKPADFPAKLACIECLTKLEARPYFERDFGDSDSLAFAALFRRLVTWTETIRDRQTHSVFTGRLDPNWPQFQSLPSSA
tara:strand:- start:41 stop:334 length:294 start_codon:yes stop_codon:yes gene_type:complete